MTSVTNLKTNLYSYGQTLKMCEFLIKGDSYFKGKNVDTTKINKEISIKSYCSNDDCKTNEERINALTVYIYMEFKKSIRKTYYNKYDECFLMWVSDKLFRIHNKSKGKKDKTRYIDTIILKSAYEKYLKNHKVKLDYWELFDSIKGLKEAYLRYMAEFYLLLIRICKTVVDYKDNGAGSNNLSKYSDHCLTQYRSLYLSISECNSYLRLLNKLKGIYDDFRSYAIKKNGSKNDLETNLKKLTNPDGVEMDAVRSFKPYIITKKKCYSQKKKAGPPPLQFSSKKEPPPPQSEPQPAPPSSQKSQGGSNGQDPPNISDSSKKNTGGGGSSGDVNPGDRSNGPTSSTSEGSFDWGSSIFKFILNGTEILKKTSDFIDQNQKKVKEVTDKIINVYNGAMDDLKKVYDKSNKYLNNFISNVTSHLNSIGAPSKPDGNPSEPEKSINGGDSPSQLPSNSPTAPIDPTDSSTSKKDPPPNLAPSPIPQKQPSPQSQHIIHQTPDVPAQVNQPNSQQIGQLVNSLSSNPNLKKTWNIFPTTWNGSGDCKPEIKFMNATLVCCTSKQCSLTGVSVTLILIPIILLIAYKCLSFGSSKKSEKKNMKGVIKLVDGNRKTKIIISSDDRIKRLKPVINSVGRKKDPLLNIYKLMQADPIPFINLFFLLIFFVYKRKSDCLEL
ncbi:PIR protein CIR protein [Plasmodium vinckei vinckei]|uniref:PIR protein CIR protein n=1 Tax=Plasmodium vinckei vinckei TaxID=54757 RepID=A0A449BM66_PLAVN|nr:PIR protein CIR protein [Plasmodium vinckei vinckei]VEV54546.1 PIR protein CIR protein [Plasmodium vinckei vinckei]